MNLNQELAKTFHNLGDSVNSRTTSLEFDIVLSEVRCLLRQTFRAWAKHQRQEEKKSRVATVNPWMIPCTCEGRDFASINDAAEYFGIRNTAVANRLKSHYWPEWTSSRIPKTIQVRARKTQPLKCTIEGQNYESIAEAARALNLSTGSVFHRLHSNKHPEWKVSE